MWSHSCNRVNNSSAHLAGCRFVVSEWSLSLPARGIYLCSGELRAESEPPTAAIRLSPCPPPPGIYLPPTREGQKLRRASLLFNQSDSLFMHIVSTVELEKEILFGPLPRLHISTVIHKIYQCLLSGHILKKLETLKYYGKAFWSYRVFLK